MKIQKLTGLIAAPHTAFQDDGNLRLDLISRQAEWLAGNEVAGAFICGTTGEWSSLTVPERLAIAERWVAEARNLKVIVHAGHNALADCRTIAAHAQKVGAYAVAAIAPDYFRPASLKDLVDFCAEIAAAAPDLPFYYYHMPVMSGAQFAMIDFLKMASSRIPNLAGLKFTHENLMDYRQCVAFENGRFDVLFGRDEILLAALAMGAEGAVGSTYNFAAPIYLRMMEAFQNGDLAAAREQQTRSIEMIAILSRFGGLAAGKAVMKIIGLDCGPVRRPLTRASEKQFELLHRELAPYLERRLEPLCVR